MSNNGRPLREVVSWNVSPGFNTAKKTAVDLFVRSWVEISSAICCRILLDVDLFVRSWVEMICSSRSYAKWCSRPLREVVSWNSSNDVSYNRERSRPLREVVSWNNESERNGENDKVDLFVRSWVEIFSTGWMLGISVVDLFVRSWVEIHLRVNQVSIVQSRPLREVVSWNRIVSVPMNDVHGRRPLREVVSWNVTKCFIIHRWCLSTSSWGRELKWNRSDYKERNFKSTSSWGRELKYQQHIRNVRFWNVDLFVRSWVEIFWITVRTWRSGRPLREVVSWNRNHCCQKCFPKCRPLREVVSWNKEKRCSSSDQYVDLFVRSWVEMICCNHSHLRQIVDLFVRSWVEIILIIITTVTEWCRPLREVVSWNQIDKRLHTFLPVDLFVRSWVEICRKRLSASKC